MWLSSLLVVALAFQETVVPSAEITRGLRKAEPGATAGYVLFAPILSRTTFLIDGRGETVHTWEGQDAAIQVALLDDGSILRSERIEGNPVFQGGGTGGRIRRTAKDGAALWEYVLSDETNCLHHGFERLPNGNLLCIAWERLTRDEAIELGRDPAVVTDGLWSDWVFELRPTPPTGGEIVWEWHAKDHLIQDFDAAQPNHGAVAARPERIDVNGDHRSEPPLTPERRTELDKLEAEMRALGYAGGSAGDAGQQGDAAPEAQKRQERERTDWMHTNSVDYQQATDLILLSVPRLNEIWILDHSTTSEEARGSRGGRWKKGGDLLYRWGNPALYGAGTATDRKLFFQHQPEWVAPGLPGGGHVLVFNNGQGREPTESSSVDELELPFDPARGFVREQGKAFGPVAPLWSYSDPPDFYSHFISGCQRLPSGNTFVCSGKQGRFFEVTPAGVIVWEYWNPHGGEIERKPPPGEPPSPVEPTSCFRAQWIGLDHPALAALGVVGSR
jgi:Arylsulfotransferase (ASST)